jgi:hypothetical protein
MELSYRQYKVRPTEIPCIQAFVVVFSTPRKSRDPQTANFACKYLQYNNNNDIAQRLQLSSLRDLTDILNQNRTTVINELVTSH